MEEIEDNVDDIPYSPVYLPDDADPEEVFQSGLERYNALHDNKYNAQLAFTYFLDAAEKGHSSAQRYLGTCYKLGIGVEENVSGQCLLAELYFRGKKVQQNYKKAAKWFTKAAEQGNEWAQCGLGDLYRCGWGVQQNDEEAFKWYRKSASNGYPAQRRLGNC